MSPYKEEYGWASDDLLAECSTLTSVTDVEAHRGDPTVYNFNAFHKTHDSHVLVCCVKPGEPVCVDSRATGGSPFFFLYQMVFKRVGLRLPFTKGAAHRNQHRPCPASSQQLGLREGFSNSLRVFRHPLLRGCLSSFFRGEETR